MNVIKGYTLCFKHFFVILQKGILHGRLWDKTKSVNIFAHYCILYPSFMDTLLRKCGVLILESNKRISIGPMQLKNKKNSMIRIDENQKIFLLWIL